MSKYGVFSGPYFPIFSPNAGKYGPEKTPYLDTQCMTQEMCQRAVHRSFFVFDYIPDKCKTQEICNLAVSLYPSFIVHCPYKYITQESLDNNFDEDDPDSIILVRLLDKSMLWAWSWPPTTIKTKQ